MYKIKKYVLDPSLTYEYFCDYFKDVNELSTKLLKTIDFKNGMFFTFLCDDIDKNQLYQFEYGGVASCVKQKTFDLVLKLVKIYPDISAVFDNFNGEFSEDLKEPLFLECGFHYKNEVYHVVNKETVTQDNLQLCFYVSNAIWHSLCVLSKIAFNFNDRELTDDQIKNICANTQLILVGAYDDESFVFWKRNDFMIGELLETDFVKQS